MTVAYAAGRNMGQVEKGSFLCRWIVQRHKSPLMGHVKDHNHAPLNPFCWMMDGESVEKKGKGRIWAREGMVLLGCKPELGIHFLETGKKDIKKQWYMCVSAVASLLLLDFRNLRVPAPHNEL